MFPSGTRLLVIDDTKTIRILLREILSNMGFTRIDEAEDGTSGLEMLKAAVAASQPYGFIICDWNMPGLTGLQLLEIRNADPVYSKVPFLMVTIESEKEYVLKAVVLGVSDFIVKPFSEATVRAKMQGVFSRLPK